MRRTTLVAFSLGLAIISPAPAVFALDGGYKPAGEQGDGDPSRLRTSPVQTSPVPTFPIPTSPSQKPPAVRESGRLDEPDTDEVLPGGTRSDPFRDFGTRVLPNGRGRPDNYGTVIGPGGVVPPPPEPKRRAIAPKKKTLTAEEQAAAIRRALTPKPSLSAARRHTLDDLYGKLAAASEAEEAKGLATLIANIWMRSGSDTANLLMQRAAKAQATNAYPVALDLLDRIVELQPNWAEAWNRRATVRFLAGDLDGSMADVEHVLKLEPKHFGALQGMGLILQKTGFDKQALEVYRRALAIYPHQPELKETVDKLTLQVEGQGI